MSPNRDTAALRSIILDSQHLLHRSPGPIEQIVSDLCGLQYDPYPALHLNQYIMLFNRMQDFRPEQLDKAAYEDFRLVETWAFRRNMFLLPRDEYPLYRQATKGIERWGESDEGWLAAGDSPEVRAAEEAIRECMLDSDGLVARELWERLGLSDEWDRYRRQHDQRFNLPIFRACFRMIRRGALIRCGRRPGVFREPVYILREKTGIPDWTLETIDEKEAVRRVIEKLIISLGVTDPVHVAHISGYRTAEVAPVFSELSGAGRILPLQGKIGRKQYYLHASKEPLLHKPPSADPHEVRLISPMDTLVRDKAWLSALFDYSFSFEYFKKKGMKWPLSILVGNQFVGYADCRMDWRKRRFIIRERCISDPAYRDCKEIDHAIRELAAFHDAAEIVEESQQ